jgi:hypothetical protein
LTDPICLPEPRPRDFSARLGRRARAIGARRRRGHVGRRLAVLAVAVAVPAMAQPDFAAEASAALSGPAAPGAPVPLGFEIPGESFPGSAFYYLEDQAGLVTGDPLPARAETTALALPRPQPFGTIVGPGPAARALRLAGTMTDRARAQYCLTLAVYYEAASEADAGQRAVAQVVLNRVAHPTYPSTVCGVVFQGSERSTGCQFSFTCDGAMARKPAALWWDRAARVAAQALAGAVYQPAGLATHYHTVQVHPYWADSLDPIGTIGAHRFYRWRGAAGRPAAFSALYRGGEPVAAPHPRLALAEAAPADSTDPVALARVYELSLAAAPAATAPALLGAPGGTVPKTASGLETASGQVRAEYANSGRWLVQP